MKFSLCRWQPLVFFLLPPIDDVCTHAFSTGGKGAASGRSKPVLSPSAAPTTIADANQIIIKDGPSSQPSMGDEGIDRPLLQKFGKRIKQRINCSKVGEHRLGEIGAYTSAETIPCLDMQVDGRRKGDVANCDEDGDDNSVALSSRDEIRMAFTESSRLPDSNEDGVQQGPHGRSSGSGCSIIRLSGSDATSIHRLIDYANHFFDRVDNNEGSENESPGRNIEQLGDAVKNAGVFRIANHVYAGFDEDVNGEGKMQFLDTRMICPENHNNNNALSGTPMILPMEVGDLVGSQSISDAHKGMETLMNIGSQITTAVLRMDDVAAEKLIDDGTSTLSSLDKNDEEPKLGDNVSNSYHRLVRYLKPQPNKRDDGDDAAFQAHVDSSFLTLIPMPELPGLEVWCPEKQNESRDGGNVNSAMTSQTGEWVRPIIPQTDGAANENRASSGKITENIVKKGDENCAYVIAMAGEFLQLVSDGEVPVCIHRVIPPSPPEAESKQSTDDSSEAKVTYKMRISAPLFLRPRRGKQAFLDVENDLNCEEIKESIGLLPLGIDSATSPNNGEKGLYHIEGLLEECDARHLWSAHEIMSKK